MQQQHSVTARGLLYCSMLAVGCWLLYMAAIGHCYEPSLYENVVHAQRRRTTNAVVRKTPSYNTNIVVQKTPSYKKTRRTQKRVVVQKSAVVQQMPSCNNKRRRTVF